MVVADDFAVLFHASADVAHGVSTAADVAGVGSAAVDDATVVEAALIGLEFDRDRFAWIALHRLDLIGEDGRAGFDIVVIGEALFTGGVRAGNDVHAPVFLE